MCFAATQLSCLFIIWFKKIGQLRCRKKFVREARLVGPGARDFSFYLKLLLEEVFQPFDGGENKR